MARKPTRFPRVFHNVVTRDAVQYVLIFEKFYVQWRKGDRYEVVERNGYVNEALREWEQNDRVHDFVLIFP